MVLWLDPMRPALLRDRHAHFDGSIRLPADLSLVDDAEFPGGAVSLVGHGEAVSPPCCSCSRLTTHIESPLAQEPNFGEDRKSTRLNSSHVAISYAVFCLKKKNTRI